jgi:hypothetical protein
MKRRGGVWAVLTVCLLVAGCAGVRSDSDARPAPDGRLPSQPTPTLSPEATPTPEPVDPDNPYGHAEPGFGFDDSSTRDADRAGVVAVVAPANHLLPAVTIFTWPPQKA